MKPGNIATTIQQYLNYKRINEASFHTFSIDMIISDGYVKHFIDEDSSQLLDYFIEENDLDETKEDEIRSSSDFYNFIYNELEEHYITAHENIYDRIDDSVNKITIYRVITVQDNWIDHLKKQGKRLGIYWSWDSDAAEAHWGDSKRKNETIIEVDIDEKYVDWITTFKMNTHPIYSEEREIRLFKNTPIKIKSISINDEVVDISILGDKTFYS